MSGYDSVQDSCLAVQVQLDNQVIEDLLMEAIIMQKFNHPNVLNMFGISVYEEKPCIILPFMSNGNLKDYLAANKSVSRKAVVSFSFSSFEDVLKVIVQKCQT